MLRGMTHQGDPAARTATLTEADFAAPIDDRWFEDYTEGAVYEYGYLTVSAAEIREFAERFDPQPIHTDPAAAAAGPFGTLIASGWHTTGLFMRMFADHYLSRVAAWPRLGWTRCAGPRRSGRVIRCGCGPAPRRCGRPGPGRTGAWCTPRAS